MFNLPELHMQTMSYRRGVDPGEYFPAMSSAAPLGQNLWLLFFAFGRLLAGGTQKSTKTWDRRPHY